MTAWTRMVIVSALQTVQYVTTLLTGISAPARSDLSEINVKLSWMSATVTLAQRRTSVRIKSMGLFVCASQDTLEHFVKVCHNMELSSYWSALVVMINLYPHYKCSMKPPRRYLACRTDLRLYYTYITGHSVQAWHTAGFQLPSQHLAATQWAPTIWLIG